MGWLASGRGSMIARRVLKRPFAAGASVRFKSAPHRTADSASGPRGRSALSICSIEPGATVRVPKNPAIPHTSVNSCDLAEDTLHTVEHRADSEVTQRAQAGLRPKASSQWLVIAQARESDTERFGRPRRDQKAG